MWIMNLKIKIRVKMCETILSYAFFILPRGEFFSMFLAIREIKHEKTRYGLIIAMVTLISYLMLMMLALMMGLSNENTAAIRSWDTQTVFLNKNANENLAQSLITSQQAGKLSKHEALVGSSPVVIQRTGKAHHKQTIQFIGLDKDQYIYQDKLKIVAGHRPRNDHQITLDEELRSHGYHLGDRVKLNSLPGRYQVVGFSQDTKLNIAPVAVGSLSAWRDLKGVGPQFVASGIFTNTQVKKSRHADLSRYSVDSFIKKLPGYSAQNNTFMIMIGFLMVISFIIIAVFLYILTMQKKTEYALIRAQGIPARMLVNAALSQAFILMLAGEVISLILMAITMAAMPNTVPMMVNWPIAVLLSLVLLVIGLLGALLPVRMINKIDPLDAI